MYIDDSVIKTIRKRYSSLVNKKKNGWETMWRSVTDFIVPYSGKYTESKQNPLSRNHYIENNCTRIASRVLRSGLYSGLLSKSSKWFRLSTSRTELLENDDVKAWFYEVEKIIEQVLSKSNFYESMYNVLGDCADFGTSVTFIAEDYDNVIRCYNMNIGEYCLANDSTLEPTTLYREITMTVGQIVERFGIENVSESVKTSFENNNIDSERIIVHVIEPNDDRIKISDLKKFVYRSIYYEKSSNDSLVLEVSGYDELPFIVFRWDVRPDEVYGWGVGFDAVPDAKQLMLFEKESLYNLELVNRPPLVASSDFNNKRVTIQPSTINIKNPNSMESGIAPIFNPMNALQSTSQKISEIEQRINETYYTDLFRMLLNYGQSNMTATEVNEKVAEKLQQLGSVVERINGSLDLVFNRILPICLRVGLLPEPPAILQNQPIKVDYISMLNQAQKASEVNSIIQFVSTLESMASVQPNIINMLNYDSVVKEMQERMGVPPTIVKTDQQIQEMEQAQAQAQQQQEQMQQMQAYANGAKTLSQTNLDNNNVLGQLSQQMGNNG